LVVIPGDPLRPDWVCLGLCLGLEIFDVESGGIFDCAGPDSPFHLAD